MVRSPTRSRRDQGWVEDWRKWSIFEKQLGGEENDQSNIEVHRGVTRTQSDPQGGRSERPPRKWESKKSKSCLWWYHSQVNAKWLRPKVNATNTIWPPRLEIKLLHKMENVSWKKAEFFLTPAQKGYGQSWKCKEHMRYWQFLVTELHRGGWLCQVNSSIYFSPPSKAGPRLSEIQLTILTLQLTSFVLFHPQQAAS